MYVLMNISVVHQGNNFTLRKLCTRTGHSNLKGFYRQLHWLEFKELLREGKQTTCILHKRGRRCNCCPSTKTWTRWLPSIAIIIIITTTPSSISAPVSVVIPISISVTISVSVPITVSVTIPVTISVTISITISVPIAVSMPMKSKDD